MSDEKELATLVGDKGVQLKNLGEAMEFATVVSQSGLAPRGMEKPEQIMVAVQTGMELGMSPMQAIQSIAVINGKATLSAQAMLALVRSNGGNIEAGCRPGEGHDGAAVGWCKSHRGDGHWIETTFSTADAKKAGLWGKTGPWSSYPKRMLQHRATSFHCRDYWSDALFGLMATDEAIDIRPGRADVRDVTPTEATVTGKADPLLGADTEDPGPFDDVIDAELISTDLDEPEDPEIREAFGLTGEDE